MVVRVRRFSLGILAFAVLFLSGCATIEGEPDPNDPFESFNRSMFAFNRGLDQAILAPISSAYVEITPAPARTAVYNVFDNLSYLTTVVNQLLQGKFERGMEDLGRFLFNSTFGLGGMVDFSTAIGLERHEEDFGQTLAVWGWPKGDYLELPLLGPTTTRDLPGIAADTATDLLTWLGSSPLDYALGSLKTVEMRAGLDSAIKLRDTSSLDPYVFQREAYLQRRRYLIYDGNPPLDSEVQ